MLQTLLLITAAHSAAVCEIPPAVVPPAAALSSTLEARVHRPGWLERLRTRRLHKARDPNQKTIDRTLWNFFRSLRHRATERRSHRSAGLFHRLRDRRGAPTNDDPAPGARGAVTVPHEDPVDLPLYPQPNQ